MFARIGGGRYLPVADSPAREKHARLIAAGMAVEYLKRSQCRMARYDRSLGSRGTQGMSFRATHGILSTFRALSVRRKLIFLIAFFNGDDQCLKCHERRYFRARDYASLRAKAVAQVRTTEVT